MIVRFFKCSATGKSVSLIPVHRWLKPILFALLFFTVYNLHAQQQTVTGTVLDQQNKPLANASVLVSGTKRGTATNDEGKFTIAAVKGNVLVVSNVGYITQRIKIEDKTNYSIVLAPGNASLNDVVVVGLQRQTRRNTVAAISGITAKDIQDKPVASVDVLLQGRVSGMNVQVNSGQPGATPTVVVRGNSKVNTSIGNQDPNLTQAQSLSGPLYVIDGVPIDPSDISNALSYTGTNFLAGININDIQSVDVQKDAAATAAWGSRGANGVIYITTKKGTSKTPIFDVDLQGGITRKPELLPTLTGAAERQAKINIINQYSTSPDQLATIPQLLSDSLNPYFNNATDWQGIFYRTGVTKQADATMSAASDVVNYRLSVGYYNEDGIIKQTGYQRYSLRGNFGFKINSKLSSQLIVGLSKGDNQQGQKFNSLVFGENNFENTPFGGNRQPTSFYYINGFDSSIFLGKGSTFRNRNISNNYSASLTTNYDILPDLRYTLQGSAIVQSTNLDYFRPAAFDVPSFAESDRGTYNTYLVSNSLNYTKQLQTRNGNKHDFVVTLTHQYNSIVSNGTNLAGYNTPSNDIRVVTGIPQSDIGGKSYYEKDALLSLIGQLQYDYNGKYLLYGSYRGDASSRFGANAKWGYFPAAGIGWIISDEKFMSNMKSVINFLKVRFSYGIAGTQAPDFYAPFNNYVISGTYNGQQAVQPSYDNGLTKNNLTWAKSIQKNLGVELNVLNNRINLVAEFYDKLDKNGIYNFQLPFFTGFNSINFNANDLWVDNRGIDITLNTRNLSGHSKLQWNSTFILTYNKNAIAKLPNNNRTFSEDDWYGISRIYQVGQPIYEFFQMKYAGVYNRQSEIPFNPLTGNVITYFKGFHTVQPGDPIWVDANGDGDVWSDEDNGDAFGDRVPTGDPNPKFTGGFVNDFTYKNFSLSVATVFTWKRTVVNTFFQQQMDAIGGNINNLAKNRLPTDLSSLDYWTPAKANNPKDPNYKASFPSITPFGGYFYQFFPFSSMFNVDGSYFKVKYVTLSYMLPQSFTNKLKLKRASVSAQMANVLIIKNKNNTMPDPELVDQFGVYNGDIYPQPQVFTLGVDVQF